MVEWPAEEINAQRIGNPTFLNIKQTRQSQYHCNNARLSEPPHQSRDPVQRR